MDYVWDACYAIGLTSNPSLASVPVFPKDCQRNLYQYYEVFPEIIGQGSFGCVRRVKLLPIPNNNNDTSNTSNSSSSVHNGNAVSGNANDRIDFASRGVLYDRYYACKTIPKSNLYDRKLFRREVYNLNRCQTTTATTTTTTTTTNSNCVIRLLDVIEDRSSIHIITEMCWGGELYDYVVKEHSRTGRGLRGKALSPYSSYSENDDHNDDDDDELRCATIIFQILTSFKMIHERARVCHRDMKASNFVFVQKPSFLPNSLNLRVIDFGLSKYVGKDQEQELKQEQTDNHDYDYDCKSKKDVRDKDDSTEGFSTTLRTKDVSKTSINSESENDDDGNGDDNLYSKHFRYMTSEVGAPYYVAPEVLMQQKQQQYVEHHVKQSSTPLTTNDIGNKNRHNDNQAGYTTKCDIWSIGVLTFLTLTGTLPILGKDEDETVQKLMNPNVEVDFSDYTLWEQDYDDDNNDQKDYGDDDKSKKKKKISVSAQRFCKALLQRDPKKRPTAREALRCDWIVKHFGDSTVTSALASRSTSTSSNSASQPATENATEGVKSHDHFCRLPSLSTAHL